MRVYLRVLRINRPKECFLPEESDHIGIDRVENDRFTLHSLATSMLVRKRISSRGCCDLHMVVPAGENHGMKPEFIFVPNPIDPLLLLFAVD